MLKLQRYDQYSIYSIKHNIKLATKWYVPFSIFITTLFLVGFSSGQQKHPHQPLNSTSKYIFEVGQNAKDRLKLSENIYGSYSKILFHQLGLKKGSSIAVMGCGTGENLLWLSNKVGPEGTVLCADISSEQLKLAEETAQGLQNVRFLKFDVVNDNLNEQFDFVTSRFLLVHVTDPIHALKKMTNLVKIGGYLLCEEHDTGFIFSYPLNNAVLKAKMLIAQISKDLNVDYEFGRKLLKAFHDIGLKTAKLQMFQPIFNNGQEKMLLEMSIREAKKHYVPKYISEIEIEQLLFELNQMSKNHSLISSVGGLFQVYVQVESSVINGME